MGKAATSYTKVLQETVVAKAPLLADFNKEQEEFIKSKVKSVKYLGTKKICAILYFLASFSLIFVHYLFLRIPSCLGDAIKQKKKKARDWDIKRDNYIKCDPQKV